MDDHGEGFDSVSWPRDPESQEPRDHAQSSFPVQRSLPVRRDSQRRSGSMSSEPQAGENADGVDLAGVGVDGILECTVDTPLKENDGTKDAYVSYLVTTHVHTTFPFNPYLAC
jgi:sorting nexin-4